MDNQVNLSSGNGTIGATSDAATAALNTTDSASTNPTTALNGNSVESAEKNYATGVTGESTTDGASGGNQSIRADSKITSHFYVPMHPA